MFIGREEELNILNDLYASKKFEFVVMYGRRRIGKTSLLKEFATKHKSIFFSAEEKSSVLNLADFGNLVLKYFNQSAQVNFADWKSVFTYISDHTFEEKTVIIIDEFPFLAKEDSSIKSVIQHIIDHQWQNKNIMLILCGSSVSFMINEVMGYKSPLYGRRTASLEIKPFDYLITQKFYPNYSAEQKLITYAILGGIPYYLQQFSDNKSIVENINNSIIKTGCVLREEPLILLRTELREPYVYNGIIQSIANGASKLNEIATKINETPTKCSVYINNLKEMRIVDKIVPCTEKETSKKSIYALTDNFYLFWYKYVFSNKSQLEFLNSNVFSQKIFDNISDIMGIAFEKICYQYLVNQAKQNKLPFIPEKMGKWWGNNPKLKKQDDIDILAVNDNKAIFCECKFRNEKFDLQEFNDLIKASEIFENIQNKYYYVFVKNGFTQAVIDESKKYNVKLLTIQDLFD